MADPRQPPGSDGRDSVPRVGAVPEAGEAVRALRDEDFARLTPPWDELARPIADSLYGGPELRRWLVIAEPAPLQCACGETFATRHGLAIHRGRRRHGR